jgi:hypothetical protein
MKLAPFATGFAMAAAIAVSHGPAVHAQTHTNNSKVKQASTEQVFASVNDGDTLDRAVAITAMLSSSIRTSPAAGLRL